MPLLATGLLGLSSWLSGGPLGIALLGAALMAAVMAAVHHAELVAHKVGEPLGTLVLALAVTVSVGVARARGANEAPEAVFSRADAALYDAKRAGRGVTRLFDESMDEGIRFRRRIEHGLGQAIARDELSLVYQPIVERNQLEVTGFEALVRWNTQEYGPISPATFIPIAEESNVIHELGDWILDTALAMGTTALVVTAFIAVGFDGSRFYPEFVERAQAHLVDLAVVGVEDVAALPHAIACGLDVAQDGHADDGLTLALVAALVTHLGSLGRVGDLLHLRGVDHRPQHACSGELGSCAICPAAVLARA